MQHLSPVLTLNFMDAIQIGYARVSTTDQDLTAQRDALLRLGVQDANIYVDHGMTGTNRARPGLREALTAVRTGDTLVVTKLDRLARSLRDARDIADELTAKGVALSLEVADMTPPIRWGDCCSTCSQWLRSSSAA
jgi:DNA invertase Pin-like site-specific DNA recombinase